MNEREIYEKMAKELPDRELLSLASLDLAKALADMIEESRSIWSGEYKMIDHVARMEYWVGVFKEKYSKQKIGKKRKSLVRSTETWLERVTKKKE